ncbi:MAG TPA: MBL fold metallo-hydrolase [Bacillota bacterium]|nr:MBL fold metallo-hydrolase [Bacillota bacterium]
MKWTHTIFKKLIFNGLALLLLLGLFLIQTTLASAPMAKTQVPGYFRMPLGDYEVTALYDGHTEFGLEVLMGAKPKEIQALLGRSSLPENGISASVIAYLINTGMQLILVDTGAGGFWKGLGALMDNVKAAGYSPEQVDLVLLTHLHVDHDGGLLTGDGKAAFPNAEIRMAKAENDFWTSADNMKKAPESLKGMYTLAQTAVSVYQGRWKPFTDETELVPGIKPVPLSGHTVGHTGYQITSKGQTMLIWGDIVHSAAVQIPKPDVAFAFDTDPQMAVSTRESLLKRAVTEGLMVAGSHLPYPGIGRLQKEKGEYRWNPVEYTSIP